MAELEQLCPPPRNPSPTEVSRYGSLPLATVRERLPGSAVEVDRCWGVPIAGAIVAFLSFVSTSSYGYLYVLFMDTYGVNRQQAAWPQSGAVIAGGSVGLLVSLAQQKLSVYKITLMGAVVASTGVIASSFSPNIAVLTITFGVLQGAGVGSALLGIATYLMMYFDKYKATAIAIKDVGTVVAGVAAVPIASCLTRRYGLHGCLLMMGGLMLHMLPVIILTRTPRPFRICGAEEDSRPPSNGATGVIAENGEEALSASPYEAEVPSASSSNTNPLVSSDSVLSAFTMPMFYALVLFQIVSDYTFTTYATTIVDYIVDKGTALTSAKKIVVYSGLGQACGRVVVPFLMDKIAFNRTRVAAGCIFVSALCFVAIPFVSTFGQVVGLGCVAGVAEGYILCIKPVLMADHIGLKRFSFCCGVAGIVGLPVWFAGPAILGFFRDARGSYDYLYFTLAGLNFGMAVLLSRLACK
ncbi:monocarboxylate transporter 12-like [Amblyomma americanum]